MGSLSLFHRIVIVLLLVPLWLFSKIVSGGILTNVGLARNCSDRECRNVMGIRLREMARSSQSVSVPVPSCQRVAALAAARSSILFRQTGLLPIATGNSRTSWDVILKSKPPTC